MNSAEGDPYDFTRRSANASQLLRIYRYGEVVDNDPLAISLIANVESAESKLMGFIVSDYAEKGFKPVSWDEMAELVWIPVWRERANERREVERYETHIDR